MDSDAPFAKGLLQLRAERFVLDRHQLRQQLDDGDLGTERAVDRRELDTHRTRAEYDDRGRYLGQGQGVVRVDDALAVELHAGEPADHRAGGQDRVPGFHDVGFALGRRDLDLSGPGQPAATVKQHDAVLFE